MKKVTMVNTFGIDYLEGKVGVIINKREYDEFGNLEYLVEFDGPIEIHDGIFTDSPRFWIREDYVSF